MIKKVRKHPFCSAIFALSVLILLGWLLGIEWLVKAPWDHVTTKPATVIMAIAASTLQILNKRSHEESSHYPIFLISGFIMTFVWISFSDMRPGEPSHLASESVAPGIPSLGTLFGFFVLACYSGVNVIGPRRPLTSCVGGFLLLLGTTALIGHIKDIPPLYYHFGGVSTAMSTPTSVIMQLLGISMLFAPQERLRSIEEIKKQIEETLV